MIFSIIITIVAFGLMVTMHEAGHFFTAKAFGVWVKEFSVGMGPLLAKFTKGETQYSLRALPIGGYVSLDGEEDVSDNPRAFVNISPIKRICILLAGAAVNVLVGFLCFVILTGIIGTASTTNVTYVAENSPAQKAQLNVGDKIVKIDNTSVATYEDLLFCLMQKPETVKLTVLRDGEKIVLDAAPDIQDNVAKLGISVGVTETKGLSVLQYGFYKTRYVERAVFYSLKMLVTGEAKIRDMAGPVGIVSVVDETTDSMTENGYTRSDIALELLYLFAMISVNLGIVNLLPFPALDGGSIIFAFASLVSGKKLNQNILSYINAIGLALILALGVFIMGSDILHIFGR